MWYDSENLNCACARPSAHLTDTILEIYVKNTTVMFDEGKSNITAYFNGNYRRSEHIQIILMYSRPICTYYTFAIIFYCDCTFKFCRFDYVTSLSIISIFGTSKVYLEWYLNSCSMQSFTPKPLHKVGKNDKSYTLN